MYPEYGGRTDEDFLRELAVRDYGTAQVADVWALWSEALTHTVTSNEDQYGPLRVGPAYPFVFQVNITRTLLSKEIPFPCSPHAMMGNGIIKTLYQPYENANQSPGILRYPVDLQELDIMLKLWSQGCELLNQLLANMPQGRKSENGIRLLALGRYMENSVRTVINIKKWYLATVRLKTASSVETACELLDQLRTIACDERENVLDTIPYVETDSRLGWEPSMEYVCDRKHLEFALVEIEQYRNTYH